MAIYNSEMSYQDQNGGYPPPREQPRSQYPPPPGEEDERAAAYHQRGQSSSSVTLPSLSQYEPQYSQPPNGYPPDPRAYQQDPYRPPPPPAAPYRDDRAYQPDYGRGGQQQHMNFSQSAPRQRTAIACRYCRRRKVSRDKIHWSQPSSPFTATNYNLDSLFWFRSESRGSLFELPALPAT